MLAYVQEKVHFKSQLGDAELLGKKDEARRLLFLGHPQYRYMREEEGRDPTFEDMVCSVEGKECAVGCFDNLSGSKATFYIVE